MTPNAPDPGIELRRADDRDRPAVLALLSAAMGWRGDDDDAAFFSWKHDHNPAGASPAWVAVADGRIVGLRTFLRWEFVRGAAVVRAVRAVDTATHPDYQGRGLFSRLTRQALEHLADDDVGFVFNTPNSKSLPGYLKMGWQPVGRLPVAVRPRAPATVPRLLGARAAAEKRSLPTTAGIAATEALHDEAAVSRLLEGRRPPTDRLATRITPEFLRWRYGDCPLGYRALLHGDDVGSGVAFFRLRRRGTATEAVLLDVLTPPGGGAVAARLARRVVSASGADYGLQLGRPTAGAFVPVPRLGPQLVWRDVCERARPPLGTWALRMGDVELF